MVQDSVPLRRSIPGLALAMLVTFPSFALAQQSAPLETSQAQKRMVAELSGWSSAAGQTVPFSRSTPEERAVAASYLIDALAEVGLTGQVHEYRLPNINGLVDLLFPPYRGANVFVEVPATDRSDGIVVLGAHYDSEFQSPGAVDNATGVALVWAVAQRVSQLPTRTRDFVFVFFDQEEDDEVGSRAFVRFLRDRGSTVHSVHIADLAGWDEGGEGLVKIQSPTPELEQLYRQCASTLGIPLEVIGGAHSDNKSFLAAGIPTVGVFQAEINPQLHSPSDTYDIVDFAYMGKMTRLIGDAMQVLAEPGG